jgi:hypothetical protein
MIFQTIFASKKTDYEPGMDIRYDETTHVASIDFRGYCFETEDLLKDRVAMVKVAEDYCRGKGWSG